MYKQHLADINGIQAGCLLGDGYLTNSHRITMLHSDKFRSYVVFKYNLFTGLGIQKTSKRLGFVKKTNLGTRLYSCVETRLVDHSLRGLEPYAMINILNPLGLMLWWLDDGCLSISYRRNGTSVSRFGYLNTQAFDRTTNEAMSIALFNRFGISTKVHIDSGSGFKGPDATYYRLYLNATNMRLLIDIIRDFIHMIPQDMLYKINMQYVPNRLSTSSEHSAKYNF